MIKFDLFGKKKGRKSFKFDLRNLKREAITIEKDLVLEIEKIKHFLKHTKKAKIEDSKISVDVNDKGDIEIEFGIKALIKK